MIAAFPAPVLALAADKIAELEGGDALEALWALFTKCKGSLQDGPRLENISWRLWHRQLRASQQSSCRPLTPDSPLSESLSAASAQGRGSLHVRPMPTPSPAMPALPRPDINAAATAYRSPAPSVLSASSQSDVSADFSSHAGSQFHFLGDHGSVPTPPPPSITPAGAADLNMPVLHNGPHAMPPSTDPLLLTTAFIPSPSTSPSPTLWSQSSHSSTLSHRHVDDAIQRQSPSTPNVRDANKKYIHIARNEGDHRNSTISSGRSGADVESVTPGRRQFSSRTTQRTPAKLRIGKIICDIIPNHAFSFKPSASVYPASVPSATPPRSSPSVRNRSQSSALQRPHAQQQRRCPLPTPEHESYAAEGVLMVADAPHKSSTQEADQHGVPTANVTVTLTPSPSPSPVLGEKGTQLHQYPQPYPPSSGSSASGEHSDDTQHVPATPTMRPGSKSTSSPTTPSKQSTTPNKGSTPTTPNTPLRLNLAPRLVFVDPTPNPTPHPTPPTTPTPVLDSSAVPSFIQAAKAPKMMQAQAPPSADNDVQSLARIARFVRPGAPDASGSTLQNAVMPLPIPDEPTSNPPNKPPSKSSPGPFGATSGVACVKHDNDIAIDQTLKPSDRRFFLRLSPEERSLDSTSPSGSSGITSGGSGDGVSAASVEDGGKGGSRLRSRSSSPREVGSKELVGKRQGGPSSGRVVGGRGPLTTGRGRRGGSRGSPGRASLTGSSIGTNVSRSFSRSRSRGRDERELQNDRVTEGIKAEVEVVRARPNERADAMKARSASQDGSNPKAQMKKSNSNASIGSRMKTRGMLVMTKAKGREPVRLAGRGARRTLSGGAGAAKRTVSGSGVAAGTHEELDGKDVDAKGKARATFDIGSTSSEGKDSLSMGSAAGSNTHPSLDAAIVASRTGAAQPSGLGMTKPPAPTAAEQPKPAPPLVPPAAAKASSQTILPTDPAMLKALLDNPLVNTDPAALLNPKAFLEAAAAIAQPHQRRRVVVTNTSSEDYETETDSGDSDDDWASEDISDDEVVVSRPANVGAPASKQHRKGPSSGGQDTRVVLPTQQPNVASRASAQPPPQRSRSESQQPTVQFALPNNPRQQGTSRNNRPSAASIAAAKIQAAALEAQRQRELFTKQPVPQKAQILQRTRSGLLSQLMNPDPEIFPANHPYRTSYSAVDLRQAATLPRIYGPNEDPAVASTAVRQPVNGIKPGPLPGPPKAALAVGSMKSAAVPLAQQVTAQMTVNGSGGSTGYRPKGRPQEQEMEDESDSDDANDKVPISQSVAQQRLAALAGRRTAPVTGPGPQQQQQQAAIRRPPMPRALTSIEPQQSSAMNATPQPVATPVAVPAPYNLPPAAPPSTPRTTRRMMLQTEMSESLRRNLLWERQVSKVMVGQRRRSSGAINGAPGSRPGHLTATPSMVQLNPKTTDSNVRAAEERERERQFQASQARENEARKQRALARNRSWADDYHYSGW
ncbi:hypothetical protein HGRIS_004463 [Hohenbuehelia grisea]|uniref:Nitrogen regulatory protein areA GATA-like domain-containing protein n=1 Tax=Hohenbuehelia grisea TaxID=104357 RepID=A0ABR3JC05_9AGAR